MDPVNDRDDLDPGGADSRELALSGLLEIEEPPNHVWSGAVSSAVNAELDQAADLTDLVPAEADPSGFEDVHGDAGLDADTDPDAWPDDLAPWGSSTSATHDADDPALSAHEPTSDGDAASSEPHPDDSAGWAP